MNQFPWELNQIPEPAEGTWCTPVHPSGSRRVPAQMSRNLLTNKTHSAR